MKVEVGYENDHKQIRNFVELHSIIYDNDDDNVPNVFLFDVTF